MVFNIANYDLEKLDELINQLIYDKEYNQAEELLQNLIEHFPEKNDLYFYLGLVQIQLNKINFAEVNLNKYIDLEPNNYEAYNNLSYIYIIQNNIEKAKECWEKMIDLKDDDKAFYNLGLYYINKNDFKNAEYYLKKTIQINNHNFDAYFNLGSIYYNLDYQKSLFYYDRLLFIQPNNIEAHWNKSLLLLKNGFFQEGWSEFEWRLKKNELYTINTTKIPLWNGEDLKGKKILLLCEQGFGDNIQFIRFIKNLKAKKCFIILYAKEELKKLFSQIKDIDKIITSLEYDTLEVNYQTPLLSLPYLLKLSKDEITQVVPYIKINDSVNYKKIYEDKDVVKIGIFWTGSKKNKSLINRHCKLKDFEKLFNIKGTSFYSLQLEKDEADSNLIDEYVNQGLITDLSPNISNFYDTAVLINSLDLIITIDSAIAHLAGALGKQAWVMLDTNYDWRWYEENDQPLWYPTIKLYKQEIYNDWSNVFYEIKNDLNKITSTNN